MQGDRAITSLASPSINHRKVTAVRYRRPLRPGSRTQNHGYLVNTVRSSICTGEAASKTCVSRPHKLARLSMAPVTVYRQSQMKCRRRSSQWLWNRISTALSARLPFLAGTTSRCWILSSLRHTGSFRPGHGPQEFPRMSRDSTYRHNSALLLNLSSIYQQPR
jgi:hypothetical protein